MKNKRYYIEFEMEEHHCMHCPIHDPEDICKLQIVKEDIDRLTWEQQLANCPLKKIGDDSDEQRKVRPNI